MLTIAVSSRSLFQLEAANEIFENAGQIAYDAHMREHEDDTLQPGTAFELVRKLLNLNRFSPPGQRLVDVALLSRNSPDAGVRIMKSVMAHGLDIQKAVFTAGRNRFDYAREFGADLFLCASEHDARKALESGIAAARIQTCTPAGQRSASPHLLQDETVRIAFDGDSVIFSNESDLVFHERGLEAFIAHEIIHADVPMDAGPLMKLLKSLSDLQAHLMHSTSAGTQTQLPLHIGLVTARSVQNHARVLHTLRTWGLSVNEVVFAGGSPKGPLLRAFAADFFFDDTGRNVESATESAVAAAQVPYGKGGIVQVLQTAESDAVPALPA